MGISRRSILKAFGLSAAGLFVPTKTIFLSPSGGWNIAEQGGMLPLMDIADIRRFLNEEVENHNNFLTVVRSETPTPHAVGSMIWPVSYRRSGGRVGRAERLWR